MRERTIEQVLASHADQPVPDGLFHRIRAQVRRRRTRRRAAKVGITAFILAFAFLTFVPGGGDVVAAVRQEFHPTLFLRTNLAEAQQTARTPLTLPATVPSYLGEELHLGPDVPAFVGRWLDYETVGVTISEQADGMGVIYFDLRRSTYVPAAPTIPTDLPEDQTTRPVKVGPYEGLLRLHGDHPLALYWQTPTHSYKLVVGGVDSEAELIHIAQQIR